MFKTIKNQKGITLVELLAVMVIVGIIAAISIPAIGNLIENTRKDAYIATAKNLQEAARLVASQNADTCATVCAVQFGTVAIPTTDGVSAKNTISGLNNIENIDSGYTQAYVVVRNSGGTVNYETTLTGTTNTTYKLGTTTSTSVNALDVMTWNRDVVIRAVN